jgi:ribosomal protein L11 methyltransferase
LAIDNDDWSIENAAENISRNNCSGIQLQKADSAAGKGSYDIILANINKNVILDNMASLASQLQKGSILLLSGLLADDEADIKEAAAAYQLQFQKTAIRNGWICMQFSL